MAFTFESNARGQKVGFSYDPDGNLVGKKYGGDTRVSFDYDKSGNPLRSHDDWGTTTFTYDARDQVTQISYPSGKQVGFQYDAVGNLQSISYPSGFAVNYTYDSRNRPVTVAWSGQSVTFTYDGRGNPLTITRSNGTSSSFSYDGNDRLLSLRHKRGEEVWANLAFTHDFSGNTTQEVRELPLTTFQDPGTLDGTINSLSQLTQLGEETLTYDPDGNLLRAGSRLEVLSDPEDRPISIRQNGVLTEYTYDGLGRRVAAEQGIWKRYFHYDQFGNLLFETDEEGTVTASYIYTAGGGLLTARRIEEETTFYHFDSRGSALAVTDSGGEIVAAYSYDPFGRVVHQSGSIYNPFTYGGAFGVLDDGEGLFFMRARFYDASLQRFLAKDPIGLAGGGNPYSYTGNGPIDSVDPFGLAPWEAVKGLLESANLPAGSTGAQWLREGFETMRHWRQGQVTYTMLSKTIDSSPGIYLASQYFRTWIAPLLTQAGRAVATGVALPSAGTCAVAGTAVYMGWGVTGLILQDVGKKANLPRVEGAGKWMGDVFVGAHEKAFKVVKDIPYFVQGLGIKLGLVNP